MRTKVDVIYWPPYSEIAGLVPIAKTIILITTCVNISQYCPSILRFLGVLCVNFIVRRSKTILIWKFWCFGEKKSDNAISNLLYGWDWFVVSYYFINVSHVWKHFYSLRICSVKSYLEMSVKERSLLACKLTCRLLNPDIFSIFMFTFYFVYPKLY